MIDPSAASLQAATRSGDPYPSRTPILDGQPHVDHPSSVALPLSEPVCVTQSMIVRFSCSCKADTVDGKELGALAPQMFSVALLGSMRQQVFGVKGAERIVNYGLGPTRFYRPLRAGATVRARFWLVDIALKNGSIQAECIGQLFEADTVFCEAHTLTRYYCLALRG